MLKGAHITLMIGPAVPVPVKKEVLDALTGIKVTSAAGSKQSGFELTFNLDNRSSLHTKFLLSGGNMVPVIRVIIIVTFNGSPEILMDGVMLNHQVSPGKVAGQSTLTVMGKDLSVLMDWIDFSGFPYPAMSAEARVAFILMKYSVLGIVPMVIPSVLFDVPDPIERISQHQGNDLCYINILADDAGYVFYIEPGPAPGRSVAYWGPEIKVGVPQPALNIDMDAHTNVESLNFDFDKEKKEIPVVYIQNKYTKSPIPVPIPDITPLNPPLGLVPPIPPKIKFMDDTARLSPIQAAAKGLAYAAYHADAVTGTGSLDVLRYKRILKSRKLVGVRGAGLAYDGLYYVTSVTHTIKRGEYKQNFTLVRNGLVSTLRKVPA